MLLVIFSMSQSGATGFVPNMFVAQKKLNKSVRVANTTKITKTNDQLTIEFKEKKSVSESEKKPSEAYFSEVKESVELESATTSITRFIFKWMVSYLSMGRVG